MLTDAFPLTASGKVQKFLLRAQFTSGQAPALPQTGGYMRAANGWLTTLCDLRPS